MRCLYLIFTALFVFSCKTSHVKEGSKKDLLAEKGVIASYLNAGKFQNVQKRLQSNLRKHPRDADFPLLMGLAQMALSNPDVAEKYFRRSLLLKKTSAATLNLSSALVEQRKYREAKNILAALVKDKEYRHKERAYHNLGYLYQKVGKHKTAVSFFSRALKSNPTYHVSWQAKAKSHIQLRQEKKAYQALKNARLNCAACYSPVAAMVDFLVKKRNFALASRVLREYLSTVGINPAQADLAKQKLSGLRRKVL
jgi:Tfp pilus assembly protein PilF